MLPAHAVYSLSHSSSNSNCSCCCIIQVQQQHHSLWVCGPTTSHTNAASHALPPSISASGDAAHRHVPCRHGRLQTLNAPPHTCNTPHMHPHTPEPLAESRVAHSLHQVSQVLDLSVKVQVEVWEVGSQ